MRKFFLASLKGRLGGKFFSFKFIRTIIVFLFLFFFTLFVFVFFWQFFKHSKTAYYFLTADTSSLESFRNRTNILLLGIGGQSHEASDLTDTIIFISFEKTTADTFMVSIPRDIWLDSYQAKINALYSLGEAKSKDAGFAFIKDAIYQILNQPIHYVALIDFEGFVKLIDLLGGIEVKVERAFDDYYYPISGKELDPCGGDPEYKCRYEHIHFDAGKQIMDGETALKFVRSRNAEGEEGTDFSRSQRQQKVILALIKKIFSLNIIFNQAKIKEIKEAIAYNLKFDTQFSQEEIAAFLTIFWNFVKNKNEIRTVNLDYGDNEGPGFLYHPLIHYSGQWVLLPRNNNWQEVHKYLEEKIFKGY